MGCCYSRVERQELVSRCKARRKYMKQFVKARQAFSAAHSMYLRSLRTTGSALLQFATGETNLHSHQNTHHQHHLPPLPPSPPPHPTRSTTSEATTRSSSAIHPPPPPPPLTPPSSSGWDFWDPFMPYAGRSVDEEEWEETTTGSEVASVPAAPPSAIGGFPKYTTARSTTTTVSSELAVVPTTKSKDLGEIMKELDDYFLKAADACAPVSLILEIPTSNFIDQRSLGKDYKYGKSLSHSLWTWGSTSAFRKYSVDPVGNSMDCVGIDGNTSNCSTVEKLYAWEKKLYQEVKNSETMKLEHEKKAAYLRKLEMKRADYVKTEKAKKEVEKLESHILVASQAIETTSAEIVKLRELELYPQLVELIKGLMNMWRRMYECHQVQTDIVQQLKYLNCIPSTDPTSEIHRQATLQLEAVAQQWHLSFCNLVKAQHDYIQSLTGWLRLSLFEVCNKPFQRTVQDSAIYSLCDDWQRAITNAPDKVASGGIKSFLAVIHAVIEKQAEEQKQKKRAESAFKEHEKKVLELRALECKFGPYSMPESDLSKNPLRKKQAAMEASRAKAEDEKAMYEKSISVTRLVTLNSLQMGLPRVFQALTGFANVCTQTFESVQNRTKSADDHNSMKLILPQ
ncbi:Hypothetical predicted protein [Olea europaea subsp. europaea]|uniref:Nitrate regulatory gene2 protein n=1 Tax=Olea europaea subsp. europaea TaxID=158383 RepID=A0A8S0RUU4_OLEEU|nr:Hypothetical predicted protein [Olea europaea subsp. europaea]